MCGIGGVIRIIRPGDPDYPDRPFVHADPWLWQGRPEDRATAALHAHWLIHDHILDRIDARIAWRGPDGQGRFRDRVIRDDGTILEIALVHRRLSILDHQGGPQPMIVTECPRCAALARSDSINSADDQPDLAALVFNGCIYNHRELRRELESAGHVFRSDHSDTEVILHACREYRSATGREPIEPEPPLLFELGPADQFDGMFAFALWDRSAGRLLLARDRSGEKPLVLEQDDDKKSLIFASAPINLPAGTPPRSSTPRLSWIKLKPEPIRDSLADWIALGSTSASLPHARAFPLPLGRAEISDYVADTPPTLARRAGNAALSFVGILLFMAVSAGLLILGQYLLAALFSTGAIWLLIKLPALWAINEAIKTRRAPSAPPLVEHFDEMLSAAVLSRLDADVPVGCFLSGGVDSSLIAHYAAAHLGELTTLTVRMPDQRYDESPFAQRIADHLGTRHIVLDCDTKHAADDLVRIITTMGLPFGDSSILPTYWLCRAARQHVKVALAGDAGDELFFGYDRYRAMRYLGWRRIATSLAPARWLDRSDPTSHSDRAARLITAARNAGYLDLLAVFPTPDRIALIGRVPGTVCRQSIFGNAASARTFDLMNYLPGDLLRKVDTASMMCGLEVRCPFLASNVRTAALAVGADKHMPSGETKHILKELARRHFPPELIDRPKQGFAVPISDWFRNDTGGLRTLLLDMLAEQRPFGFAHDLLEINLRFVRRMIDEHWAAGGLTPIYSTQSLRPRDHGQRLFSLLTLAIWARIDHAQSQLPSRDA